MTVRNPQLRVLLVLHTFYFVLIGSLDLLCVILAVDYLHMGRGGPGFLNAALGGGALLAGFVTAFLVGRRHLAGTLTVSLSVAVVALALIDAIPRVAPAILLIGTVGLAGAVFDTTGRILLQRSAPSDAIAGLFSILEALMDSGLAAGCRPGSCGAGHRWSEGGAVRPRRGGLLPHRRAVAPAQEDRFLGDRAAGGDPAACGRSPSLPLFRRPRWRAWRGTSSCSRCREGTVVIQEGERGDCYYAVAEGELAISRGGQLRETRSRGVTDSVRSP